ncbi:TRAP transporter small permease [Hoeflea sp. CAU 1731]
MSETISRVARVATLILEISGAALLVAMMLMTFADVIGRYFFNSPIDGAFELTELMLATLLYCGLPLISMRDGHVTVDLLEGGLSSRTKRVRDAIVNLLMAGALAFLTVKLWGKADLSSYDTTAILEIPLAPLMRFMAISCGVSAILTLMLLHFPHKPVNREVVAGQ